MGEGCSVSTINSLFSTNCCSLSYYDSGGRVMPGHHLLVQLLIDSTPVEIVGIEGATEDHLGWGYKGLNSQLDY